jgi:hypothetical protein
MFYTWMYSIHSPPILLVSYYIVHSRLSESFFSSQASSSPIVRYPLRYHLSLSSLFGCHFSHPAGAFFGNLTEGDGRCRKRQTEDQTCIKLGLGRLCAQMETHQPSPPPASLLYTVAKWGGEAVLGGGGCAIVILRNRSKLWSLLSECKHLRKNSCTTSCQLLQINLSQLKLAVYWA